MAVIVAIVLTTVVLSLYLPNPSFSQIAYLPNRSNNITADQRIANDISENNNTSIPPQASSSHSHNKVPTPASASVTKTAKVANHPAENRIDKFGIKEIYPTKVGSGREWHVNMASPVNDSIFSIGDDQQITKQNDGSWRVTNPQVRMHVSTPPNFTEWKNVEVTGYIKVNSTMHPHGDIPTDIAWLARGGRHNDDTPCDGTALIGGIHDDGTVGWKKEIWFTGGYTDEQAQSQATNTSIVGRWIGWKVVMYNTNNNSAVKMESYLDDDNNNHWRKVTNLTDNGGWYADTSDKNFNKANCGKPKNYVITNSGPDVMFRSDNLILDFKNLSVREIQASEYNNNDI
jgi:hypothetical protein